MRGFVYSGRVAGADCEATGYAGSLIAHDAHMEVERKG
mgnify:CR=1 FL=1